MKFWQEHMQLRTVLMAVLFVAGLALVVGWRMTGSLTGLGIMLLGLALLLTALYLYNKPFSETKKKKKSK